MIYYIVGLTMYLVFRTFGIALWEIVQFGALPYCDLSDRHVLRLVVSERSIKLSRPDVSVSSIDRL